MPPTTCSSVTPFSNTMVASRPAANTSASSGASIFPVSTSSTTSTLSVTMENDSQVKVSSSGTTSCPPGASKLSRKTNSGGTKGTRANGKKSVYKHVPHALKPVHLVAKRNARERRRVQAVNSAFIRLRKHVPYEPRHKRLSKVKTLRVAITYISHLQDLIREHDRRMAARINHHLHLNHHNHPLNILADAAATTSTTAMTSDDNTGINRFNNDFHFLNGPGGSGLGEGGGTGASMCGSSRSSHLHHTGHASMHLHGRHGGLSGPGVEQMHNSWMDGLHYTGHPEDDGKAQTCSPESSHYFVSPPCEPPAFDGNSAGFIPYDVYSLQSPYQLLR